MTSTIWVSEPKDYPSNRRKMVRRKFQSVLVFFSGLRFRGVPASQSPDANWLGPMTFGKSMLFLLHLATLPLNFYFIRHCYCCFIGNANWIPKPWCIFCYLAYRQLFLLIQGPGKKDHNLTAYILVEARNITEEKACL